MLARRWLARASFARAWLARASAALERLAALGGSPAAVRLSMVGSIVVIGIFLVGQMVGRVSIPVDSGYYWAASGDFGNVYGDVWGVDAWYVYPPPLAQAFVLLRPFGHDPALAVWGLGLAMGYAYVLRGWSMAFVGLGLAYVALPWPLLEPLAKPLGEVLTGNVQWLLIACIVGGFRWPVLWAIPILTKVSPIVGVGWFLVRREWRPAAWIAVAVGAIGLVSFVLTPSAWPEWLAFVQANAGVPTPVPVLEVPLVVRLPIALGILAWGGLTDRRWTVFVAVALASPSPYLGWLATLAVTAVVVWRRDRPAAGPQDRAAAGPLSSPA